MIEDDLNDVYVRNVRKGSAFDPVIPIAPGAHGGRWRSALQRIEQLTRTRADLTQIHEIAREALSTTGQAWTLQREPQSWVLSGAGAYGSDVEVVSLDAYRRLAAQCENAEAAALMWGRKCLELEGKQASDMDAEVLAHIARALRLPIAAVADALAGDGAKPKEDA